jgi:hypothetical protein
VPNDSSRDELDALRRRIELLEEDNQRLREKLEPILGPDNPCFDARKFQLALGKTIAWISVPAYCLMFLVMFVPVPAVRKYLPNMRVLGLPLIDAAGISTRHPGIGLGIIAFGGAGIGVIGVGGLGVGIIAAGGGAIGLVAIGGGALGLIAVGGGACGLIAIGGGAAGYYALGQRGAGKYVLAVNRQDDQAIELFGRWFPALRAACTRPMPVIPVHKQTSAA